VQKIRPAISGIEVRTYVVPTDHPEGDGTMRWDATTAVVVHAYASDQTGMGWSYTDAAAADVVRNLLAPAIVGTDARDTGRAASALARALRNAGAPGVAACALSAVDVALWDLRARLSGLSLVDAIGRVRDSAPVYGSGGFTTYDDARMAAQLRGWVEEAGVAAVKIKIGEEWGSRTQRDLERVATARDVVGPTVRLMVDANGAYTIGQARRIERDLREFGVSWFEEPVTSDDPRGLARLRASSVADIAAGEYVYRLSDAQRLLEADAVDCLQLDVTRCGGVTGWLRAAAAAEAHQLTVSAHCAPQLAAHVSVCTVNARDIEYFHDHARLEPMLFDNTLEVTDGVLTPRTEVIGHGLSVSDAAAEFEVRSRTDG
jgi:L-alanine-DL-glutamate epimerase-like enolase superfamily enzyme